MRHDVMLEKAIKMTTETDVVLATLPLTKTDPLPQVD